MRKKVIDLKTGDKLASGILIKSDPQIDLSTPKDKAKIKVEYPDGKEIVRLWNKNTSMRIL